MTTFKSRLREGTPQFGVIFETTSPLLVEIAGWIGADFVFFDMEHGDGIGMDSLLPMLRAADVARVPAIVRVPLIDIGYIQRLLDWGAAGICAPHVRTVADALQLVELCRYPPLGRRSSSWAVRAFKHGTQASTWEQHMEQSNDDTVVMALVEDPDGMEVLDAIAEVPGLDVLWIGPGDLARSMGVLPSDPVILAAQGRGLEVARQNGLASLCALPIGLGAAAASTSAAYESKYAQGYRLFCWADSVVLQTALKTLFEVRPPRS